MKQVYQTDDGQLFEDAQEAQKHEHLLFTGWLQLTGKGKFCQKVFDTLDNKEGDDSGFIRSEN